MSKLKVLWTENKTAKTGRPYKKLSVEDEKGEKVDVNIFSTFPDFANVIPGSEIMGTLKQDGQYWNITPDGVATTRGGASGAFKQKLIEDTMTRKESSIEKSQDRKEDSIRLMAAQRDAVLIVKELLAQRNPSWDTETIKEEIISWRNWFLSDDFKEHPPF